MEIGKVIKFGDGESKEGLNASVKEYEECSRCLVLQDKLATAEDKCAHLELEIGKKNSLIEGLGDKIQTMESKIVEVEDEVRALKQRNQELEQDKVRQLIENKVLECEKNKAESETEAWNTKVKDLEMQESQLEKNLSCDHMATGTPPASTASKNGLKESQPCKLKSRVKRGLEFTVEGRSHLHISPSTPGGRSLLTPIDIFDSDDDSKAGKNVQCSADVGLGIAPGEKKSTLNNGCTAVAKLRADEKEPNCNSKNPQHLPTPKRRKVRRGATCIVSSESESDCNDNIPICELMSKSLAACTTNNLANMRSISNSSSEDWSKEFPSRRRLMKVGHRENKAISGKCSSKTTDGKCEIEEEDSSSEGESLGGFIVKDSDVSGSEPTSSCNYLSKNHASENGETFSDDGSASSNASDSSVAYDVIISDLKRERKNKMKWINEGEMLADFGKYPEVCMKAVCALYRQQTSEEKSFKATLHLNRRGFSQIHAFMGSALAEFLTDGDPQSDMNKSVELLQEYDRKGVEKCWKLATHYSKQLFEIYKNKEDPFFRP